MFSITVTGSAELRAALVRLEQEGLLHRLPGGRYAVRGGAMERLENAEGFTRLVVLEFPSLDAARAFYFSPEYAPLLKLRMETTESQVVLVDGFVP